jgi:hypothetical protein
MTRWRRGALTAAIVACLAGCGGDATLDLFLIPTPTRNAAPSQNPTLSQATRTRTPTPAATATAPAAATRTPTPLPNSTSPPPTATRTARAVTPTGTRTQTPMATNTIPPVSATFTPASTAAPATATQPVATVTNTPVAPTSTPSPPAATSTATGTQGAAVTPTFTATATPTEAGGGVCGNGLLENGETCEDCPADCAVQPCAPTSTNFSVTADLVPPLGQDPTAATILLAYDSSRLSIPGSGNDASVRQRVRPPAPLPQSFNVNDLNYGVRVVITRSTPLAVLFMASFDVCQGASGSLADIACIVEGCAASAGPVRGCSCAVRSP